MCVFDLVKHKIRYFCQYALILTLTHTVQWIRHLNGCLFSYRFVSIHFIFVSLETYKLALIIFHSVFSLSSTMPSIHPIRANIFFIILLLSVFTKWPYGLSQHSAINTFSKLKMFSQWKKVWNVSYWRARERRRRRRSISLTHTSKDSQSKLFDTLYEFWTRKHSISKVFTAIKWLIHV